MKKALCSNEKLEMEDGKSSNEYKHLLVMRRGSRMGERTKEMVEVEEIIGRIER